MYLFRFHSDDTGMPRTGFKLLYNELNYSTTCGGYYTNANALLSSPSYPNPYTNGKITSLSDPDNYPDNADCIYNISQPPGTVILLNFLSMDIEDHRTCKYDYLEIRDGRSHDSPLLEKHCGSSTPSPIQSTQNQLRMK